VEFRRLDIVKPPLTVFSMGNAPPVWSYLSPLGGARPKDVAESYRSFETYYRYAVIPGNVVGKPVKIGKGQLEADCMQQSPMIGGEHSGVSCELFAGTWMAEFVGRTDEVDNFLQIIRGIK
jgi:hypothetical protein